MLTLLKACEIELDFKIFLKKIETTLFESTDDISIYVLYHQFS